ncbi:MAG: CocE/NonD family hydrolase [Gemmatimonadaceae bacterium]
MITFVRLASVALVGLASVATAQPPAAGADSVFNSQSVMIPMRDGVRLHTRIFTPRQARGPLPVLMVRTPYGIDGWSSGRIAGVYPELVADSYVFVFQDSRGKFKSEGEFVMMRPPRVNKSDPKSVDEGSDAWDTTDWLVKNVPNNNGRVGIFGVSYPGLLTVDALLEPHPALKAASPQASPADQWLGDDFRHNGAFRLSYGLEYVAMMEAGKDVQQFDMDTYDTYDWYLKVGPLRNVNERYFKGRMPTWNDFVKHPDYDAFWQRMGLRPYLKSVTVPTLHVAGWWDQEDFYGPITIYRDLERFDKGNQNFLVVGPWNHGGWQRQRGDSLGRIAWGSNTSEYYRTRVQAPFFAHYLHSRGTLDLPEALVFEAGSNVWKRYDAWPPKTGVATKKLYFGPNGALTLDQPPAPTPQAFDAFVSDPSKPVPYRQRPIQQTYDPRGSTWSTWLTEDQRFVHNRPDVLSWVTPPLDEDVTIAGDILVTLFAATTGSDADWVVKLIDVYPDEIADNPRMSGYQFMVANEVLRGRYRESFEKPKAIVPNKVTDFSIDMHTQAYTFKKGHRIMVHVQSSWFPLIDRNPQTFVPNIFEAKESDFKAATHRVYRSPQNASFVQVQVVSRVVP